MYTNNINFIQKPYQLTNEFENDEFLKEYLLTFLPKKVWDAVKDELSEYGKKVCNQILEWGNQSQDYPPKLTQYDAYGNRIDHIEVSEGWKNLQHSSAIDGLVAIAYEQDYEEFSRLIQFAKLYMFTPSSAVFTCPLAMTDGAAKLIKNYGNHYLKNEIFPKLISRNPEEFYTSGQWMTERTGGSDISRSMTFAKKTENGYQLFGHKWFTSAITADVAFTLATTEIKPAGERSPLSLFFLKIRNEDGTLNNIEVEALKNKLGTKALPTAQLKLKGVNAIMVGEEGKGVKTIATLFNITRIYNSVSALSYMRRAYSLCKDYSEKREAFGKKLKDQTLYKTNLKTLQLEYESNMLLVFELAQLLGNEEAGKSTQEDEALLRLLTPVSKLYTAKKSIAMASELIEMFGGLGYLEDTRIPTLLRDTQVLSIWEGTTNVLSLDMLRAITKENGLQAWIKFINHNINTDNIHLKQQADFIRTSMDELVSLSLSIANDGKLEDISRELAFQIAEISIASLWVKYITVTKNNKKHEKKLDYFINYRIDPLKINQAFSL